MDVSKGKLGNQDLNQNKIIAFCNLPHEIVH